MKVELPEDVYRALREAVETDGVLPADCCRRLRASLTGGPCRPWEKPETRERLARVDEVIRAVGRSTGIESCQKLAERTLERVRYWEQALAHNPSSGDDLTDDAERTIVAAVRARTYFPGKSAMEKRARKLSEISSSEISET
jgi:hypothetical protein